MFFWLIDVAIANPTIQPMEAPSKDRKNDKVEIVP
jgi:hypothetical protein